MDAETRRAIAEYAREVAKLRAEVTTLKRGQRAGQLAHSSLEEGQTIEARDETGALRGRWGWVDGAVGLVTEGGDPVSAPTAPTVTPSLGGLRVTWDGLLDGDPAIPVDFDHMAVHVSTSSGFTPSAATYVGSIRRAGEGGMLPVVPLPYIPHYVVLIPVTTGGVQGAPSAEVSATPLQTSGIDLEVDSIEAVHIKAGAVEADKLQAVLALVTTIIAGIPGAARVEMDQDGLRGYDSENSLIFAVDSTGNAVFSGDVVASEISGSRFSLASTSGATGVMQETADMVLSRVTSPTNARAQLAATGSQAEFSVWGNAADPNAPGGGLVATPDGAVLVMYSKTGDTTAPFTQTTAIPGEAWARWRSSTGSEVRIRSLPDWSSISLTAPAAADPSDAQGEGFIYTQRYASDIAATSIQGPVWTTGSGPEQGMRAMLHTEGARPERPYTRMTYSGARHVFQQQWNMTADNRDPSDGVVELASTMSLTSSRHAPVRSELTTALTTFSTGSGFYDFPSEIWAPFTFTTSWSGRVRVVVMLSGLNSASDNSSISLSFRLSGGSTVAASLKRCALVRSAGTAFGSSQQATYVDTLNLNGNASYTVTPCYRITSGTVAWFDLALANHIIIEPLM